MIEGFREGGFDVTARGWSAHTAGHERLHRKIAGRSRDLLEVRRVLREWDPDVVYVATAHNWPGVVRDLPLALAVGHRRPGLVLHFHGSESRRLVAEGSEPFKRASRALVERADTVLLLSSEEEREWRRFCPSVRYRVVVNPFVAACGEDELPGGDGREEPPAILCVARLIPEKGTLDLIDAFALLRRRRPCRLLIAGAGPVRDDLLRRAWLYDIEDSVEVLGYVSGDALDDAYRCSTVFALPTYFPEGFPLAVMEAMSWGLPVVTTRIRGCADFLADGENTLFVPPREPEELAAALERLLDDPGLCRSMGEANRRKVAEFAPANVLPAYIEALRDAAGRAQ
jgi:glycosyltransferase involved in cell wall biosynthesis